MSSLLIVVLKLKQKKLLKPLKNNMKEFIDPFGEEEFPEIELFKCLDYTDRLHYYPVSVIRNWMKKWKDDILEAYRKAQLFDEMMEELKKLGVVIEL